MKPDFVIHDLLDFLETVDNFLVGLSLDTSIPKFPKAAIEVKRAEVIAKIVEIETKLQED